MTQTATSPKVRVRKSPESPKTRTLNTEKPTVDGLVQQAYQLPKGDIQRLRPVCLSALLERRQAQEQLSWQSEEGRQIRPMLPKIITPDSPERVPLELFLSLPESHCSGVYEFSNNDRNWFYIGSSKNLLVRVKRHIGDMKAGSCSEKLSVFWRDVLNKNPDKLHCRILQMCEGGFEVIESAPDWNITPSEWKLISQTYVPPFDPYSCQYGRRFYQWMELKYCFALRPNLNDCPVFYDLWSGYRWTSSARLIERRVAARISNRRTKSTT